MRAARLAAADVVAAYQPENAADTIIVGQIAAFSLAIMVVLYMSMTQGLPISEVVRLMTIVEKLSRAEGRCRRARVSLKAAMVENGTDARSSPAASDPAVSDPESSDPAEEPPQPAPAPDAEDQETRPPSIAARPAAPPKAASGATPEGFQAIVAAAEAKAMARYPGPGPVSAERLAAMGARRRDAGFEAAFNRQVAVAMANLAREAHSEISSLPEPERRQASLRAESLSTVARDLLNDLVADQGPPPQSPPG